MKKFNNKRFVRSLRQTHYQGCNRINSGFTLIEIIVVLIIVGILAAIALPNLFSNVSKSRAEEALATISSYRPTVEACIVKQAGVNDNNCNAINLGNPTASANFTYALTGPGGSTNTDYSIVATGQGALTNTDTITVGRTNVAWPGPFNPITCQGAGKLLGAC